jgi:hypothetical protein
VGQLAAAGNSSFPHTYSLRDAQLPAGATLLYYRLRQVDLDGTAHYSPVRTLALAGPAAGPTLTPNPARTATYLRGAAPQAPVQVFDALGRLQLSTTTDAAGAAALPLPAGLPAGVYVVRCGGRSLRLLVE